MSKEKQCECCHEWWYASDIKQDLCPNCYYYFKQLKQQLEEYKNKENTSAVNSWDEMLKNCENCGLNECIGCEYTQTCVQNIKQQLVEKDKEIASLQVLIIENKNDIKEMREFKIGDNEYDLTDEDARNDIKCQIENQTQLAIQELEKVKNFVDGRTYCANYIKKRIKELKGEKDDED